MITKEVIVNFFKKILHFKIQFIKSRMFIGLCISLLVSVLISLYLVSKLTESSTSLLASRFMAMNTDMILQGYKKFTWEMFPYPKLIWKDLKLSDNKQDSSADIDELIVYIKANDLISRKINVRNIDINGMKVKLHKNLKSFSGFYYGFLLENKSVANLDAYSDKNTLTTMKEIYLSEGFDIDPEVIKITNMSISYVAEQERGNLSFHNMNIITKKHSPNVSLLESADIYTYGNFNLNDNEYFISMFYNFNAPKDSGAVSFRGTHVKINGIVDQQIKAEIFCDADYDYRENFVQSSSKFSFKGIQKLAKIFEISIPKKLGNTNFNNLSVTGDLIVKNNVYNIENFNVDANGLLTSGNIIYDHKNKKIEVNVSGGNLNLDDFYNIDNIAINTRKKQKQNMSYSDYLEKFYELLGYLTLDSIYVEYKPEKIEWNDNILGYPHIIFNKNKKQYNISYDSDLNDGKAGFILEFEYPVSSMEVKVESGLISFRLDTVCSNVDFCKDSSGELDIISKFVMTSNNVKDIKMVGVSDVNIENLLIHGIDIGHAYDHFFASLIESEFEPGTELLNSNFEKISADVEMKGDKIKLTNLSGNINRLKLVGNAFFNMSNMETKVYFEVAPENFYYYEKFGLKGEKFYGIKLPIECTFKDKKWDYNISQQKLLQILESRQVDKKLYNRLLNLDLKY